MDERKDRESTMGESGGDESGGGTDLRSGQSSEASPSVSSRLTGSEAGGEGADDSVSERLMDTGPSMGSDSGLEGEFVRSESLLETPVEDETETPSPEGDRPDLGQSEP